MSDAIAKLSEVSPDETITAEAWNDLISAIQQLYAELDALQTQRPGWVVVAVRAQDGEQPGRALTGAEISTVAASAAADMTRTTFGRRVREVYVVSDLSPGLYDVRVVPTIVSGFAAAVQRGVQVQPGGATVVSVGVSRAAVAGALPRVPGLFNRGLQDALDLLADGGVPIGLVLDAHGQAVAVTTAQAEGTTRVHYTVAPEFATRPVVSSEPGEGMEVPAGTLVNLLISTGGPGAIAPDA